MNKLFDLLALFRKGNELANKEAWKDGGNAATLLAPLLVLVVKLLGDFNVVSFQLSEQDAALIALGIVTVVQFVIHNITSKHAGILPAKQPDSASNSVSADGVQPTNAKDVFIVSKAADASDNDLYKG